MKFRERKTETLHHHESAIPVNPGNDSFPELCDQAQRFISAADEAIRNAMTPGQSEEFIQANRQHGGQ